MVDALFPDVTIQEALSKKETWDSYQKYWANHNWLDQNFEQIREKYEGRVVVVVNQNIAFSSDNMEEIRKEVRGFDTPNEAYIRYIPAENELLLL